MNLKDKAESSTEISPILDLWIDSFTWPYRCFIMLTMGKEKMTQINDIIETLAAAKSALDENPVLREQIKTLRQEYVHLQAINQRLQDKHTDLYDEHTEACIKVTELEASLESARFQQLDTSRKLNKLVSSLREDIDEVDPQLTQPSINPAELVAEPEPVGVITEPKFEPNPEDIAKSQMALYQPPAELDKSEPETPSDAETESVPLLYSGRPYSFKPDSISWREWVTGGGQRPWWLTDQELDKLEPKVA